MPEHIAVKCCNAGQCGLFQVIQRRKDNKWQCRLCNQKQSVQKVYAVSFKASDLRPVVQEYNMKKADIDRKEEVVKIQQRKIAEELLEQEANAIISGNYSSQNVDEQQLDEQPKQSRWSKYLEPEQANDNEDEDDPRYTTLAPQGKRKGGNASSRPSKKPNNLEDKPPAPKTNSAAFGKPTKDSPSTNNKPVHAQTSTAPTFTRKYNQMFQSNTNDSDDEDSTPLFQTSAPPAKPNTVPQSDYGNRSFNNNNSTSNQPKATPKPQAPSTVASSGSRWSKYVEENNDQDKDDEDEDDQYVTASAALDSRYQVVQDPEDDE